MKYGLSIDEQLSDFLFAVGLGFVLAVLYWFFVLLRKLVAPKSKRIAFVVFDLLFTFCCAVLFFIFAQVFSDGQLRLDIAAGCALGFFAFSKTLSKPIAKFVTVVSKAAEGIFDFLFLPAKKVKKLLKRLSKKSKELKESKSEKLPKEKKKNQNPKKMKRRMKKSKNALEK